MTGQRTEDGPDFGRLASVVFDHETDAPAVDEMPVVSVWTLHVALFALQNPTPENIKQALSMIGTSGDCEEHIDHETLRPLSVPEPSGWDKPLWVAPESEAEATARKAVGKRRSVKL